MGRNKALKRLRRQGLKINPEQVKVKGMSTQISVTSSSSTANEIRAQCGYGGTANCIENKSSERIIQSGTTNPYIASKCSTEHYRFRDPTKSEQIDIVRDLELMKTMRDALQRGVSGVIQWKPDLLVGVKDRKYKVADLVETC